MNTLNLPPYAPTLIESTRAIGYSLEAAVADIIDNSIAAGARNVDIFFFPIDNAYIAILDDGIGMSSDELNCAMQYGSKNPTAARDEKDLGRFGLGLKTASLSQCRSLTVITKQGNSIEGRRWDLDHIAQAESWSLLVLGEEEINRAPQIEMLRSYQSGTLVVWQNFDRLKAGEINFEQVLGRKIDSVREHLALVYHRYLSGEKGLTKFKLNINGSRVQPKDPFLIGKSNRPMDDEILIVRNEKILVRPYILPHTSQLSKEEIDALGGKEGLRAQQGFYVYRNKRLLVWGDWFRMMRKGDLSKLVRVQIDIPNTLDDLWTLDIKKSAAIPPAEVRLNLKNIIEKLAGYSKRTWTYRGKKEISDDISHVWNRLKTRNGGYVYEINKETPVLVRLLSNYPEAKRDIEILLRQIEAGLPLNALYLDLSNDEKIENEEGIRLEELLQMAKRILQTTDEAMEKSMIETLISSEPFIFYADEIRSAFEEGKI